MANVVFHEPNKNVKPKRTRRGWGKGGNRNKSQKLVKLSLLGNNVNGLKSKKDSLSNLLQQFNQPSIITLQETKLRFNGTFKLNGYQIFSKVRSGLGGGLLTAIHPDFSPMLISTGDAESDILVTQIEIGQHQIRVINCYGPQENEQRAKVEYFWTEIEKEIINAKMDGCMVLIEMDANAKLGCDIIVNDPNKMSENGTILADMLQRQNMIVLNANDKCHGVITRHRKTVHGDEMSVLDYIVVCDKLYVYFSSMFIDEKRHFVMTKYATTKGVKKKSESDHNVLYAEFELFCEKKDVKVRHEIFDFKSSEGQNMFFEATSDAKSFVSCFDDRFTIERNSNRFLKKLDDTFHKCFKKIRIKSKPSLSRETDEVTKKIQLLTRLKVLLDKSLTAEEKSEFQTSHDRLESEISEIISAKNVQIVKEQIQELESTDGEFYQLGLWKVKEKLCPKQKEPPMAKRDGFGNLITAPNALKDLYLQMYSHRLRHRDIAEEFLHLHALKTDLWDRRFQYLKTNISQSWALKDLEKVTKSLKNNQSRDPNGMINELFKPGVCGQDLKLGILQLMNNIKTSFTIPQFMQLADITSIYKNKGSRQDLNSDRGIFVLSVLRKVFDKLIYEDKYKDLEMSMSDSNIGAMRGKNVRNHLFIVYAVINNVLKSKSCIDVQIYDLVQAFDSLWLEDCMNELYDALPEKQRDDKLGLVFQTNVNNLVAINTPVGKTERKNLSKIVQQGGCWGPMECSVSIDRIGKVCSEMGPSLFKYKGFVNIIPLAMVDDILGIAPCGLKSIAMNTLINTHIEMKRLTFHTPDANGKTKCHKMHIGSNNKFCPKLQVHGTDMIEVESDVYLGDEISSDGSNKRNIDRKVSIGKGKISEIMALLEKISLGVHYFKIGLLLRESIFLSSVLFNSEVWFGLTSADIERLEATDRDLLRRMLKVPNSTPIAGIYLELGCLRIGTIIKARRINYLHYLINVNQSEMLSRVFFAQWLHPESGDWVNQVKQDLFDFKIVCDLDLIKSKSAKAFKHMVRKKAYSYEFNQLMSMKQERSKSKMKLLKYQNLEMQTYLEKFVANEAINIFKFRVKMAKFDGNYHGQHPIKPCPLCFEHEDTQDLSFQCKIVKTEVKQNVKYEEIFQEEVPESLGKVLTQILSIREEQRNSLQPGGPNVHQPSV